MKSSNIDLAVLLIFFSRPDVLSKTFEKIKKARPSKLFLACDGPRENNQTDALNIEKCKEIVSDIDWECEVHTLYSEYNKGCGEGPKDAISWAFEYVDKLLIIEDDCVAEDSLFPFMKEMLDRYENDERIGLISGLNHFKDWECDNNSYFFAKCGATLCWGTWKRVWKDYDYYLNDANNPYYNSLLEKEIINKRAAKGRITAWKKAAIETKQKTSYWDIQFGFVKYSQSYLTIIPKSNLVYNIGVGSGSTHTENMKPAKWKKGRVLFMPTTEMKFPLTHPKFIICDRVYDEQYFRRMAYPNLFVKYFRKIKGRIFKV